MTSYTNPLGKGRRGWSGKNTPSGGPGGLPSPVASPVRHADNVEALMDAKFAKWQEQQLAMFRGMLGPAVPAQLPPGLPLESLEARDTSEVAMGIDLPDGDTSEFGSQARSVHSIYGVYDNSLAPGGTSPVTKVEVVGPPACQMVASADAQVDRPASTASQTAQDEGHPAREMVTSSLAPGASAGRQMVTSSVGLGKPDPLTGAMGEASPGTLSGPQSKAVGTHSSSSRAHQEGLREALQALQRPTGFRTPASRGSAAASVASAEGRQTPLRAKRDSREAWSPGRCEGFYKDHSCSETFGKIGV